MGESAKRLKEFIPRAVRYVIRPEDNRVIRHVKKKFRQRSYYSDIVNVSESGLLFTIDQSESLQIGEHVLVEFQGPSLNQIATYAEVVRTDFLEEWHPLWGKRKKLTVAIKFVHLPDGLSFEIRQGIKEKIQSQINEQKKERRKQRISWILSHQWKALTFALSFSLWMITLYIFFNFS